MQRFHAETEAWGRDRNVDGRSGSSGEAYILRAAGAVDGEEARKCASRRG